MTTTSTVTPAADAVGQAGTTVSRFQVMPALTSDEYAALRDDIAGRGVVVPVVVDQHGRTLDGHHRRGIADEPRIDALIELAGRSS